VESVIFKGVHYEMEIRDDDYTWTVHSTIMKNVGEKVGMIIVPDNIHIMRKGEADEA
jgi:spermidine/putrescine transport system ATP-binding protein